MVDNYLGSKLKESVDVTVQLKSDRLREEAQTKNESFLNNLDATMQKIIKEQVNTRVKKEVSKILQRIEKLVNEQLKSEVLIRSSHEAKSSHVVATNLSELELKNILIDKIENLQDAYGDTVTIKRRRDEADNDQEPSAKTDQGSKRRRAGKEPESSSAPKETTSKLTVQPWLSNLAWQEDPRESFDELMDTPLNFSAFVMNRLKVDTLTPELLVGLTFKLMKGTCKSMVKLEYLFEEVYKATTEQLDCTNPDGEQYPHDLRKPLPLISNTRGRQVIPFDHFINNNLAYLSGGVSSRKHATSVTKTKAADYGNIKWIEDLVPNSIWSEVPVSYDKYALWEISHLGRKRQQFYVYATNRESSKDVYSRRRIIAEGDLKRLWLQDIEDMLILLVQGKLSNLKIEERLAFSVALRISDVRLREQYTAYSSPRGFIYQNKDKKNRLMRLDKLYKFSDGTLNDFWTALDDRLKGIRMEYLPKTIWRQSDRERATAMI
ncbi:hypothetical protein Tco_1468236 [Tanacetum coccineum]